MTTLRAVGIASAFWAVALIGVIIGWNREKSAHSDTRAEYAAYQTDVAKQSQEGARRLAAAVQSEQDRARQLEVLQNQLTEQRLAWSREKATIKRQADITIERLKNEDPRLAALSAARVPLPWVNFMREPITSQTTAPGGGGP